MARKDDASIDQYFSELKKYPVLSPTEQKGLAVLAKEGSVEARNKLVMSNMLLVAKIVNQYTPSPELKCDLYSAGAEGLFEALELYDPFKGVNFTSYAVWWVHRHIRDELNMLPIIPLTSGEQAMRTKVYRTIDHFMTVHHREPTSQEIADLLHESKQKEKARNKAGPQDKQQGTQQGKNLAREEMKDSNHDRAPSGSEDMLPDEPVAAPLSTTYSVNSFLTRYANLHARRLDDLTEGYGRAPLRDILPDESIPLPDDAISCESSETRFNSIIHSLGHPKMEQVIYLRYYEDLTLEDTGIAMGLTRERVRQIEQKALRMLRNIFKKTEFYLGRPDGPDPSGQVPAA